MTRAIAALALPACLAVAACSTPRAAPEPVVTVQTVKVPVAVPCSAKVGAAPAYVDTAAALDAAGDIFERVKLLLAGRDQRDARLLTLEPAVKACK